jgi:hypothetical protein
MTYQFPLEPGQAPLSVTVEGGDPWGDRRLHRKHDARWRGVARRIVDGRAPGGAGYARCVGFGASADGEILTIGGRNYELDFVPNGVVAGNVAVDCSAVVTGPNLATAIAGAINGDPQAVVDAAVVTADVVVFIPFNTWGTNGNFALASTIAAGDVVLPNAVMAGGELPATVRHCRGSYTFTAADVTAVNAGDGIPVGSLPFTDAPVWTQLQLEDNGGVLKTLSGDAAGAAIDPVTYGWVQVNGNRRALIISFVPALGNPIATGDVLHWQTSV